MIRRDATNVITILAYVCDNCTKEMPGAPITKYYPDGHVNAGEPAHFCSDKCDIEFTTRLVKKYGSYKSRSPEKVRNSSDWRQSQEKKGGLAKARKAPRRVTRNKRNSNSDDTAKDTAE